MLPYRANDEVKKIFSLDFMRKVMALVSCRDAEHSQCLSVARTQEDEDSWNDTEVTEQTG